METIAIFSTLLIFLTSSGDVYGRSFDHGNFQFRENRMDLFTYNGVIENGIQGTTENVTKFKLSAKVHLANSQGFKFLLKFSDVKFFESLGANQNDIYKELIKNDFSNRLEKHDLKFEMRDGMVKRITPSTKSIQSDVLNVQRGVLSMLQVRQVSEKIPERLFKEDDVSGSCETAYLFVKKSDEKKKNQLYIEKVKDLNTCVDHHNIRSTIDGNSYSRDENDKSQGSVYDSEFKCMYKFDAAGSELQKANCKEKFLAKAFSSNQAGAYVLTSIKMKRVSSKELQEFPSPYTDFYTTSIKYDHIPPVDKATKSLNYRSKTISLLNKMAAEEYHESKATSAESFFELVISFRHLKLNDVNAVIGSVDLTKEPVRKYLFDAMAQCGTASCLEALFKTMEKSGMQQKAMSFLPFLAFIKDPNPEVIGLLMGFHQKTQHPSLILLITTLTYRMCNNHKQECAAVGRIGQTVKDTENYLLSMLGNNCQTTSPEEQRKILFALKGIGNLGRPLAAVPLIMDCVLNAKHVNVSVAGAQAMRRMTLSKDTRYDLMEIVADQNADLEKRVEVFTLLMSNPSKEDVIFARDVANDEQEMTQLRSFINSFLRSAMQNKSPSHKGISKLIGDVLKDYPLKELNLSPSRYSKAFLKSAEFMDTSVTVNGMNFFHPESFVPRSLSVNLTTHLFGFSVNALEVNARMEGLEQLLGKYLSEDGYFSTSYLKKAFKIPPVSATKRQKRSVGQTDDFKNIDEQVNMKVTSPQALVSLKMFGNEIQVFTLDDISFLNGKMDDVNIIRDLYEMTKGKRKILKNNLLLMEISHVVPTILGVPMKIALNGSAVVTVDMNAKVDAKNLIFGTKTVIVNGNIKPSVSLHASGKLSVECFGVSEIGTSFLGNVHVGKNFQGKIHYEEGKEVISELKADEQITDLLNISYNIFHETSLKKEPVNGIEKRAKVYLCTNEMFDTTSLMGCDLCVQASFPNAFYNSTAPYFPLTGPFDIGLRNYPKDPKLTKYKLHVKKEDRIYTVSLSTPDATSERRYSLSVGLTRDNAGGIMGFTFGKEKRGIVFDYIYDSETNEVKATLKSNFTKASPMILYGEFINQTDATTLNRHVGTKWRFTYQKIHIQHDLFYKNTYEYWALGSKLEYSKNKAATMDLKIQYEPQAFDLVIEHAPTGTKVLAKGKPSLPKLEGELNVTHAGESVFDGYGMIDISTYELAGTFTSNPADKTITAKAKLDSNNQKFWMKAMVNEMPINLDSQLIVTKVAGIDRNILTNTMLVGRDRPELVFKWDKNGFNTSFTVPDKVNAYWNNLFIREQNAISLNSAFSTKRGVETKMMYTYKNTPGFYEVCTTINLPGSDGGKFGKCYQLFNKKDIQGMVLKILNKDEWNTPVSLLRQENPTANTVNINGHLWNYMNVSYQRNPKDLLMSLQMPYIDVNATMRDRKTLNATVAISNGKTKHSVSFEYGISENADRRLHSIKMNGKIGQQSIGQLFISSSLNPKQTYKKTFLNTIKVINKDNLPMFTFILKQKNSPEVEKDIKDHDYTILEMKDERIVSVTLNRKNSFTIKGVEQELSNKDIVFNLKMAMFDAWSNSVPPLEDMVSLVMKPNNKMTLKIHNSNAMQQYSGIAKQVVTQYTGQIAYTVFGDTLGFDDSTVEKIGRVMQTAMISYFSTTDCNGKEIYERFIKNEFQKKDMVEVLLKIMRFPTSKAFRKILTDNKVQIDGQIMKTLKENQNKNVLDMVGGVIDDISKAPKKEMKTMKSIVDVLGKNSAFNVFEKEFFTFVQKLFDQLKKVINNKGDIDFDKLDFGFLDQYLPASSKPKVITTLKKIFNVLKGWNYEASKPPQQNLLVLMEKLEEVKAFDLLNLDYINILAGSIIDQSKLPDAVEKALKNYLINLDHVVLIQKISKFALQSFGVPAPHKSYVDNLLKSKNLDDYFFTFASAINKNGQLKPKQQEMIKKFLDTRNRQIIYEGIKDTLKNKYQVTEKGLDLLGTVLMDSGDMKSFKSLPTLYSVNFFPKLTVKLLTNMKNLNLPAILRQLNSLIKDKDVREALKGILENKQNLDEIPSSLLKLALTKADGAEISEKDKMILQEAENLSLKFLSIALGKEKSPGKLIKKLFIQYYAKTYSALEEIVPASMKPTLGRLYKELLTVIQKIDANQFDKDATTTLLKAIDEISETVAKFIGKNFERFVKEDFLDSLKEALKKLPLDDTTTLWDAMDKYLKKTDEQFSFLIRLLGQFSSSERNHFAEEFTKDGKILYYKIYQSIWKSKVANDKNLNQLAALFVGLESNALKYLTEISGDYSMSVSMNKLAEFIKGLDEGEQITSVLENIKDQPELVFSNYTKAIISIINSPHSPGSIMNRFLVFTKGLSFGYDFMTAIVMTDNEKFNRFAYDVVMKQLDEILMALGHSKQGEATLNQIIQGYLPKMRQGIEQWFQNYKKEMDSKFLNKAKQDVQKVFQSAQKKFNVAVKQENSFIRFLLDLLIPSLDGVNPFIARTLYKGYDRKAEQVALAKIKALCQGESPSPYQCDIAEFFERMSTAQKDQTFVDLFFEQVEVLTVKFIEKLMRAQAAEVKLMKTLTDELILFSKERHQNALQKIVSRFVQSSVSFLKDHPDFKELQRILKEKEGIDISDTKALFESYITEPLDQLQWTVSTQNIESKARKYVPMGVKKTSEALHKASREILFSIDKVKVSLAQNKFVTDPLGFIVALPENILRDINKNQQQHKKKLFAALKKFEDDMKALHKKVLKDVGPYSGRLNKVTDMILEKYRGELSKILDPVLTTLEGVDKQVEKELAAYMITSDSKESLRTRLTGLTGKARGLRQKYKQIQKKYVEELKKKMKDMLKDEKTMAPFKDGQILKSAFAPIDRKLLATVVQTLNQDFEKIISNIIYPQLQVLAASIDKTVCSIKKNLTKYYTNNEKGQFVTWEMPGLYQKYAELMKQYDGLTMRFNPMIPGEVSNVEMPKLDVVESQIILYLDQYPKKGFSVVKAYFDMKQQKLSDMKQKFENVAGVSPRALLKQSMVKYQHQLKVISKLANEALQFTPPDNLETPVFKFFGLKKSQPEKKLFEPISRTAYLFDKSIVTFDGKAIYLPKDILGQYKNCKYLLTRDFQWKNFTIYLHAGKFVVEMKDGKVEIDRTNGNKVEVFARMPPLFAQTERFTEFPVQMAYSSVVKSQPNILKIESLIGLVVYCRLDVFSCNVTVSGYYHNKTLGLFGTNNVENSDDLRMPQGEMASNIVDFVNSYELRRQSQCVVSKASDILEDDYDDDERKCQMFEVTDAVSRKEKKAVDFNLRRSAFGDVCKNEKSVEIVRQAYLTSIQREFGPSGAVLLPSGVDTCPLKIEHLRYSESKEHKTSHITILLKLIPNMKKVRHNLKRTLRKLQSEINKAGTHVRYSVVGYGGDGIKFYPHVQTGNGEVFTDLEGALKALDSVSFTGTEVSDRLGLGALKFASQLEFGPGTKIFLLFDNDSSYTNSLREMIDVSTQLSARGIILNTVNAYDMRRGVIGKDSYGKRYHIREPLGQDFNRVNFPSPDDYIPLVKQSRGAVFTLKAFVQDNAKWSKALPLSLSKVLTLQMKTDQNQCKACRCGRRDCKDVINQLCA